MKADRESLAMRLTAPQPAAVAVIRLDGPAVAAFAVEHLSKPPAMGRCVYCDLRDGDETIDDVVAVLVAPDRIDLNLHGGEWVTEAALRLAQRAGFRIVPWQTEPAIAADAASELEAHVALALPHAATREALAILLAQPAVWKKMLAADDRAAMARALADQTIRHILKPPTVAIIGAPNAGKSTLINRLAGQARSITADVPGTTRDYVTAPANIGGLIVNLIDTPGMRATDDAIEAEAIARAAAIIESADVIIELRDATQPVTSAVAHPRAIIVWNKRDRATPPNADDLAISAATGQGAAALCQRILVELHIDDLHSLHARSGLNWRAAVPAAYF